MLEYRGLVRLVAAVVAGSLIGLGLRMALFAVGALALRALGERAASLLAGQAVANLDPVYTQAALRSLGDLHLQGLAVAGLPGAWLHQALPGVFADPQRAHWAPARVVVEHGSPVLGRLIAAALAHAGALGVGLLMMRRGLHLRGAPRVIGDWPGGPRHSVWLIWVGVAVQVQVALGILGAQPSVRELEATGVSFAANAMLPWLALRGEALSDSLSRLWPPLVAATLVGLALVVGYLPTALILLLRDLDKTWRRTLGTALLVVLSAAACASMLRTEVDTVAAAEPAAATLAGAEQAATLLRAEPAASAAEVLPQAFVQPTSALATPEFDRWYADEPAAQPQPAGSSQVEVAGGNYHYQYLVNGEPQVIKGMGLNTQYAQQLSPSDRAAQLDSDMAALSALGVNTVLGWDPAEFDEVLLDAAQRHGVGVVMPFDLDPEADYTDPAVRQQLHDQALAWVERYKGHPALRMWGVGNEVLHKIVHPSWVGPQDPQRERNAEAFSDWLVQTADDIHADDPDHPVTYRSAEDAFVPWLVAALRGAGGGPRPWFVFGTNCYQEYLSKIVDNWPDSGMPAALWVSEFAPGGMAVPDRPDGFDTMWGYVRRHPDWVLGGAVYAWTRNGPEGVDRNFGLTDDGAPVDGRSLAMLDNLFHSP